MPKISKVHKVAHSADAMFDLVADVEKYPEFLPLCEGLTIRSRKTEGDKEIITADMVVGYKAIHESFLSRVTLERNKHQILVEYLDGPISHLENLWRFEELSSTSSRVHFSLEYEFKNLGLKLLMGVMFDRAFRKFSSAFELRANQIYGTHNL
jgi:coenzyme Q-binding protein COQ10